MSSLERQPVTVVLLTLNEEHHLPSVLDNILEWAEEVFIVDSLSTDSTVDIALERGVGIVQRRFTNFGDQWNFALQNLPIRTPWTLKLDPDERIGDSLRRQIAEVVTDPKSLDGYSFPRRLWFMGKPLSVTPEVLRLWRTGKCRFSDVVVNEHPLIDGNTGRLTGILEHYDSRDLYQWLEKQNRYTTMEAIARARNDQLAASPNLFGTRLERRMFAKRVFFSVPLRYQLYWLYLVFLQGAWRSGKLGLTWAHLRVQVLLFRELKAIEIGTTGRIPDLPCAPHGDYDQRVLDSELQRVVMLRANSHIKQDVVPSSIGGRGGACAEDI